MKLSVVFGTRPEVIKLASLVLEGRRQGHEVRVILTGQHGTMAQPLLRFFGIEPDVDLSVMRPGQTLTGLSQRLLERLDEHRDRILGSDFVAVQGDTTSAFIAGYWAFCHRIRVAHVEAGLRTYDLAAPFPEEGNRQLLSRIASVQFAPTEQSRNALLREQVASDSVFTVGNSGVDSILYTLKRIESGEIRDDERLSAEILNFLGDCPLILVTGHRRESFGAGFDGICEGIRAIARARPDARILYPVHPNPNVRAPVEKQLAGIPNVRLCEPQQYVPFVGLMKRASVLLTDSGGIQEEGPSLRKPIVVMREKTERPEGVEAGFAVLTGTDPEKILKETLRALDEGCKGRGENPYGDGHAARRMIEILAASM